MTRRELAELCLAFPDSYEDAPFHDPNWTVIRHRSNRKCFAMIYERGGNLCINLKCDPMRADFLCKVYEGIDPGYHMNKQHWITVIPDSDGPLDELYDILRESIHDGTRLILNADDPLVSCFGDGREDTVWFGVERTEFSEDANSGVYDDGRYCPRCKSPMRYDYYHFNHIGKYRMIYGDQ